MNLPFTQQGLISRTLIIHVICLHLCDILRLYHEEKQVSVVAKVSGVCAEDQKRAVWGDGAVLFVAMVRPLCMCKIHRSACQGHKKANFASSCLKCFKIKNKIK